MWFRSTISIFRIKCIKFLLVSVFYYVFILWVNFSVQNSCFKMLFFCTVQILKYSNFVIFQRVFWVKMNNVEVRVSKSNVKFSNLWRTLKILIIKNYLLVFNITKSNDFSNNKVSRLDAFSHYITDSSIVKNVDSNKNSPSDLNEVFLSY